MRRSSPPDLAERFWLVMVLVLCFGATADAQTLPKTRSPKPVPSRPLTASGNAKEMAPKADVVARLGSTDVSAADIKAYIATLGARERAALANDPALLNQTVRALLANRLVLQQALEKKWDKEPGVVEQLERARESTIVELYLQAVSAPSAAYPGEDDIQKVYTANRAAFLVPRQFDVAQIFVPVAKGADPDDGEKAKQRIDEITDKLKSPGADFSAIARGAASTGDGHLGWLQESQIRPEIRTKLMSLAKNDVTDPIKLEDGWHILKLLDTRAAYTATLPEIRDQLVQQMRAERSASLRRNYIADLLKRNPPYLNELALSGLIGQQTSAVR